VSSINCPRDDEKCVDLPTTPDVLPTTVSEPTVNLSRNQRKRLRAKARKNNKSMLRDHPSRYLASHQQVGKLVAKCLPAHSVDSFLANFEESIAAWSCQRETVTSSVDPDVKVPAVPPPKGKIQVACTELFDHDVIVKTPVKLLDSSLRSVFGDEFVSVSRCYAPTDVYKVKDAPFCNSDFDIIVVDCILARQTQNAQSD
jgi:hypothetical protein